MFRKILNTVKSFFAWFFVDKPKDLVLSAKASEVLEDLDKAGSSTKKIKMKKQLTKNFHIDEFKCRDGSPVPEKYCANVLELAKNLQVLRNALGKPIKVNSGYRTVKYNKKVGGAKKSQHLLAKAADIKVKGIGPKRLSEKIKQLIASGKMKKGGVGLYPTFTHYDIRGKNARWSGTRKKN